MKPYEPPVVTPIGNMRDLLSSVCVPHEEEQEVRVAGFIVEFERDGWRIRVQPMYGEMDGPFQMTVTSPAGVPTTTLYGAASVEEAVEGAVSSLRGSGIRLGEHEMLEIARGIDGVLF